MLVGPDNGEHRQRVIVRLWPSGLQLLDSGQPVWVGKAATVYIEDSLPLMTYLRSAKDYSKPLQVLESALRASASVRVEMRTRHLVAHDIQWHGEVLLAWEP